MPGEKYWETWKRGLFFACSTHISLLTSFIYHEACSLVVVIMPNVVVVGVCLPDI